jgi:uncharacterized membrane protein YcaP (DUF421 family)
MITAFTRTIILYVFIIIGLRLMGKRQIGELEPGELVLTMMISDLAAVPMQDFGIPLAAGIVPITILLSLSMLLSQLSLHHLRFRALVCGTPVVLIQNGEIQQEALRKNRYTLDELLEELREQGIPCIADVKYAILENSGQLSVFQWQKKMPVTPEQMRLDPRDDILLPVVLINDGRILQSNLAKCKKDDLWLKKILQQKGFSSPHEVFLLTLDEHDHVFYVRKESST